MRFTDKVAVITAAASGIGRATADIIASEGGTVIAVDINDERLEAMVTEITNAGGKAAAYNTDATDRDAVNRTIAGVVEHHGNIDILVNAVGGSTIIANPAARTDELTLEEWQAINAFNLDGMFLFTKAVIPLMKNQGAGKIINLASIAGRGYSDASSSAYAAAKGGVIAFTKKAGRELGPFGITVNAIAPNMTLTERIRPRWEQRSPDDQDATVEGIPLRRMAEAVDQARVIGFLASSDADYVTGQTIDVSGGLV
jgi:NAD(P)-dependent dehydrogenase (short-subunit alcohol dehydrogenase family)